MSSKNFTLDEALSRIEALESKSVKRVFDRLWSGMSLANGLNITISAIPNYSELMLEFAVTTGANLRQQVYVARVADIVSIGCEDLDQVTYHDINFTNGHILNRYTGMNDNYLLNVYGIRYIWGGGFLTGLRQFFKRLVSYDG